MGERRKSRELLLQYLFQCELNPEQDQDKLWELFKESFGKNSLIEDWVKHYCVDIFQHQSAIDKLMEETSIHWKVSRMSMVDRNVLRIAVYELSYRNDIPGEIAINEAIELAKHFGDEHSGAFVNGILDKIWKTQSAAA